MEKAAYRRRKTGMRRFREVLLVVLGFGPPLAIFFLNPTQMYPLPSWVIEKGVYCHTCGAPATRSLKPVSESDNKVTWLAGEHIFYCSAHGPGPFTNPSWVLGSAFCGIIWIGLMARMLKLA